jgi:hypothetical protein
MNALIRIAHPFETAGLGVAPFRFLFCYSLPSPSLAGQNPEAYNNALRQMPSGIGCGTCGCCGMALMHNYIVESSDGLRSAVGSECVRKTGEKTLISEVELEARKVAKTVRKAGERARAEAAREVWLNKVVDGKTNRERESAEQAERTAKDAAKRAERDTRVAAREAQERSDLENSRHLGVVGERRDFVLIHSHTASFSGSFGSYYIQSFRTPEGETVVYKGGSPIPCDKGATINVKAAVKAHDDYKGVKQTVIARAKVTP